MDQELKPPALLQVLLRPDPSELSSLDTPPGIFPTGNSVRIKFLAGLSYVSSGLLGD